MEFNAQEVIKILEDEELENMFMDAPDKYVELFAAYLHQNDLPSASLLWKRIPKTLKNDNKYLDRLYKMYIAMWNNNSDQVFKLFSFVWPNNLQSIMSSMEDKEKKEIFNLIGAAYTSIFENDLQETTNMSAEILRENCTLLKWDIEDCANMKLIIPKPLEPSNPTTIPSEDQLFALTDFVSFLEN